MFVILWSQGDRNKFLIFRIKGTLKLTESAFYLNNIGILCVNYQNNLFKILAATDTTAFTTVLTTLTTGAMILAIGITTTGFSG